MKEVASQIWEGRYVLLAAAVLSWASWLHNIPGMVTSGIGVLVVASAYGLLKEYLFGEGE